MGNWALEVILIIFLDNLDLKMTKILLDSKNSPQSNQWLLSLFITWSTIRYERKILVYHFTLFVNK